MQQTTWQEVLTRQELLRRLQENSLIPADELDRAAASNPGADALALAHGLVKSGQLTDYQVEALLQGRTSELQVGNYQILDKLGAGGMGTVFKARHRRMKRIVALKVLSRQLCQDENFVRRFQREVETIARLSHPNIVMAYDADEAEVGHFLVMEFVNGQDLASVVQKEGPMSVAAAVHTILQAARGLDYAHKQQIIHRDIKPANLLRDSTGVVKVTDLGLARLNTPATANSGLTQTGGILGTLDYMPPVQATDSASTDHRADIYSLGATLHFLLLGRPPYTGSSMMALLLKHREAPIPALVQLRSDVPAALDVLFQRMMAKTPEQRFQTMSEVVVALEAIEAQLAGGGTPDAGTPVSVPGAGESEPTSPTVYARPPSTAYGTAPAVLLVEPSRTQAAIIRNYLEANQVEKVISASTGRETLEMLRTNRPDVIVCAMHLKDMTGAQLAEQLAEEDAAARPGFVLISSADETRETATLNKAMLPIVLHKPFTPDQLMHAIKMARPRAVASNRPSGVSSAGRPDRSHLRVLIVDDSVAARRLVRAVLEGLGFTQFAEAADGAQAVAALAREKFNLIVTDYNMPHMDGSGLIGYLKQNPATATVPIILVTTETEPAKLDPVRRLGVTICGKDFPVNVVRGIVDRLA